jgi:glyoxylase-like metal-dependent hydrolase (beta-lactamase superfamily II)
MSGPDEADRSSWKQPGAFQVSAGVYRIPLPIPNNALAAVNVYAIMSDAGIVLVDAGWACEPGLEQLRAGLRELGAEPGDVRRVLVTHAHRDHYSQATTLRQHYGTPIGVGANERESFDLVHTPGATLNSRHITALRAAGATDIADRIAAEFGGRGYLLSGWEYPDEWLEAGRIALPDGRSLAAIETPGHTRGHLVFHDTAARVLFAGDHVLPHITPSIAFEPEPGRSPLRSFLDSLTEVRRRPDALLLPAHGPVTASAHARIDELLAHHDQRLAESQDALSGTVSTAYEVARVLRWTRHGRSLDELDLVNSMLAVLETVAHLQLLELQDRIAQTEVDGVTHYVATPARPAVPA